MKSGQKKLFILTLVYGVVWNTQYFWENLPGLLDMAVILLLLLTLVTIFFIGIFQVYKLIIEKPRDKFRIMNIALVVMIITMNYFKPHGIIDFKKFEGEDILYATYEGVANCTTSIRLKENNRFKKTTACFGIDHYWGDYQIVGDTIKFIYDKRSGANKTVDFAILAIEKDTLKERIGIIHYHSEGIRKEGIPMIIHELKTEKVKPAHNIMQRPALFEKHSLIRNPTGTRDRCVHR